MSSICLYAFSMFVNYPAVICSPNMSSILRRATTSELWALVLSCTINLQLFTDFCFLSANYYFLPLDMFNPLFSAKPMRLTTSSQVGGRVMWLCCAGLHVAANAGSAPCQSPASNTFEVFPCSFWIDNLGFITEGKLTIVLIIPSSWGSPTSSTY